MDLGLANRVALVTGASRGIGRAVAKALTSEGAIVAANARGAEDLAALGAELGPRVSIHPADVTRIEDARRLVADVAARHGTLDVLVCNVGSGRSVPPGSETAEEWQRVLALNLLSTTNMVEAAQGSLKQGGAIVCVSSICGSEALGAPVTYSAAKAALNSFVHGMARPLSRAGVRINAVAPGNVLVPGGVWDRERQKDAAALQERLARDVPLARLAEPEEIATVVCWLASPRASFVTGAIWTADGGQTRL